MNSKPTNQLKHNFKKIVVWTENQNNTNLNNSLLQEPAFILSLVEILLNIFHKNLPSPKLQILKKHNGFEFLEKIASKRNFSKLLKIQLKRLHAPETKLVKRILVHSFPELRVILKENETGKNPETSTTM